jgi:hypothetical protein
MLKTMPALQRLLLLVLVTACFAAPPGSIRWTHLSSAIGDLPNPGGSNQQTGLLIANLDKAPAASLVLSYRVAAPALVWMRRSGRGWDRYVIEKEFLTVEAGGAAYDIDGDGDQDIVFGQDARGNQMWWWENPYPKFDPEVPWKRHSIKRSGANQHHDQIFADLKRTGKPQLVYWNQRAKTIFIADIPSRPKDVEEWPAEVLYSGQAGEQVAGAAAYAEGIDAIDVDGDGGPDLLAGNSWFRHRTDGGFEPVRIGTIGGRIRGGRFIPGKGAQVVIAPGDGSGPVRFYQAKGDPAKPESWVGRDLIGRDIVHGHTLDVGDIDGDGNLDIFTAEMAQWTNKGSVDHPDATAWILYGDGKGNFRVTELVKGHGWHEGRLADVDGDGDLDIVNKPYTWSAPRLDIWLNNGTGTAKR